MPTHILLRPGDLPEITGWSYDALLLRRKSGTFVPPIKLGKREVWRRHEVQRWAKDNPPPPPPPKAKTPSQKLADVFARDPKPAGRPPDEFIVKTLAPRAPPPLAEILEIVSRLGAVEAELKDLKHRLGE